jgi:ribosomal peptide maturation radical SAM protein 1
MDVSLVVMPFGSVKRPSLGVSLLKSRLSLDGFSTTIYYFNLKLAERIGIDVYNRLAETSLDSPLIGELVFSDYVFDSFRWNRQNLRSVLKRIFNLKNRRFQDYEKVLDEIIKVREMLPDFLDDCISNILTDRPSILGLTSTFEQNCASLAIARLIKEQDSSIRVIFGGANCEGKMGLTLLRCIPWADFVCSGEGDIAFIDFVNNFLGGNSRSRVNGILTRGANELETMLTNPVMNMDGLPFPDFDDFFNAFRQSRLVDLLEPELMMETSRGCWWGEKFQCTFCGLNGSTMKFRSKSSDRVLAELKHLSSRYGIKKFQVVDNILDLKYYQSFIPRIDSEELGIELFYEIKSNVSKNQLKLLKNSGVLTIQPGIESFSDTILRIMKKGVTGLMNIQLLKWCKEIGIATNWNFLWGFPNEPIEDYGRMAMLVPKLVHLCPPAGFGRIVLDRFSPYFLEPAKYGISNVRPWVTYKYLYPFNDEDLSDIAYHFDFDYEDGRDPSDYTGDLENQLLLWKDQWVGDVFNSKPTLDMIETGNIILIKDSRPCRLQDFHILAEEEAAIYKACDSVHSIPALIQKITEKSRCISEETVRNVLTNLVDRNLMVKDDDDHYLSLSVEVKEYVDSSKL